MTDIEYLVCDWPVSDLSVSQATAQAETARLNDQASDGWALVTAHPEGEKHRYWFRRPSE